MPDVFLTRRQLLMAKLETTYGVDAAPTHTASFDSQRLINPFTLDLGEDLIEVQGGNLSRGRQRPLVAIKRSGVTFQTYVQGIANSYSATNKPPIADLLRACGLQETLQGSSDLWPNGPSYEYAPTNDVSSDHSVTIVAHQDGYEHRFVGCRGNVNLIWAAAAPVIAEFNFRGQLTTEASTTRAAPTGLPTGSPPQWIDSGTIFINSYAIPVENMNINTNNTVFESPASIAASASGINAVYITERAPGGSWDPEATEPNTVDFFAAWRSASGSVLRLQAGNIQNNRFTVVASSMVFKNVGWGDKQGMSIFSTDFELYEVSTDDQFRIVFS